MKSIATVIALLCVAACGGKKIKNRPGDMPGSPAEAERMMPANSPDKAPPDRPYKEAKQPAPPLPEPAEVGPQPAPKEGEPNAAK